MSARPASLQRLTASARPTRAPSTVRPVASSRSVHAIWTEEGSTDAAETTGVGEAEAVGADAAEAGLGFPTSLSRSRYQSANPPPAPNARVSAELLLGMCLLRLRGPRGS